MEPGLSKPKCKAILLCDKTIIEAGTGNVSLIGTFAEFNLREIPGVTPHVEAFCQIIDAEGSYEIRVEIHDLHDGKIIARADGLEIEIPDRLMRVNVIVPIPSLPIGHEGLYDFVILANGREIDRQQFAVRKIPTLPDEATDHDSSSA